MNVSMNNGRPQTRGGGTGNGVSRPTTQGMRHVVIKEDF